MRKRDQYGIYEIPDYKPKRRRGRRKRKSLRGLISFFLFVIFACMIIQGTAYIIKNNQRIKCVQLYESGDYEIAKDWFEKILEHDFLFMEALYADIRYYLADCYVNLAEYDKALLQYDLIFLHGAKNIEKTMQLREITYALWNFENEKYVSALPVLEQAYQNGYEELILYVGSCYGQMGDIQTMQNYYSKFLEKNPMNSFIYAQYASIALNDGRYEEALDYIEAGKKDSNEEELKELLFNEVVYYERIKDYNTAYEKIAEFISKYPDDEQGKYEYDFLYTRCSRR